jgi:phosphate transport system substrate-binding protein
MVCGVLTACYDPNVQESRSLTNPKLKNGAANSEKIPLKISGSTTMEPILESVSLYFQSKNPSFDISIEAKGSNEGVKDVWLDSADIAMSSHQISDSMVASFRKAKMEYAEFLLAGDALVFVVNVNNPVTKMTDEALKKIYKGAITDWKELGGTEGYIKLYSRDVSSGTFNFFKEKILEGTEPILGVNLLKDNESIMKAVAKDKNAIGYVSFANLDYSVEPLGISFDEGKTFVQPRVETVNNLKYKYFRGLYLYYKPEAYAKIKPFIDSVKTDTVQMIIRKGGYIPLSHNLIHNQ